jgi:hypothetical protein
MTKSVLQKRKTIPIPYRKDHCSIDRMNGHGDKNSSPGKRSQEENPYCSAKNRKNNKLICRPEKSKMLGHGQ